MNKRFLKLFLDNKIAGYRKDPIRFSHGKLSHWYVNAGRILSQTNERLNLTAKLVVDEMIAQKFPMNIDAVIGVPEGATELGNAVSRELIRRKKIKDRIYLLRRTPKEHGDPASKFWVTNQVPKKVLIIEDTATTGLSIVEKVYPHLVASGVKVLGVVVLIDREQKQDGLTVRERFKKMNLKFMSLIRARDVLPSVISVLPKKEQDLASEQIRQEYINDYAPEKPPFSF